MRARTTLPQPARALGALALISGLASAQACAGDTPAPSETGAERGDAREGAPPSAAASVMSPERTTDLIWRHGGTGQNVTWRMFGPQFVEGGSLQAVADPNWRLRATADMNGDGHADLIWRHGATGQNVLWFMQGEEVATTATLPAVADLGWGIVGAGDLDGDGAPDLVWRHPTSGRNVVWLMKGAALGSTVELAPVADPAWALRGVGDLDGDGHQDLVWRHQGGGQNVVWFMNRTALREGAALDPVGDLGWQIEAVDDFNGDGKADLVWRHQTGGQNVIWLMAGATRTGFTSLPTVADPGWHVAGTRRGPAFAVRGVLRWRLEYEADAQAAVSTVRGVGTDAAGTEVARAEVRVRLSDAAALGSADRDQVVAGMIRAVEALDVVALGAGAPALNEAEKRALLASFARALVAAPPGAEGGAPSGGGEAPGGGGRGAGRAGRGAGRRAGGLGRRGAAVQAGALRPRVQRGRLLARLRQQGQHSQALRFGGGHRHRRGRARLLRASDLHERRLDDHLHGPGRVGGGVRGEHGGQLLAAVSRLGYRHQQPPLR